MFYYNWVTPLKVIFQYGLSVFLSVVYQKIIVVFLRYGIRTFYFQKRLLSIQAASKKETNMFVSSRATASVLLCKVTFDYSVVQEPQVWWTRKINCRSHLYMGCYQRAVIKTFSCDLEASSFSFLFFFPLERIFLSDFYLKKAGKIRGKTIISEHWNEYVKKHSTKFSQISGD